MQISPADKNTLTMCSQMLRELGVVPELKATINDFLPILNNEVHLEGENLETYINRAIRQKLLNFYVSDQIKKYNESINETVFFILLILAKYWPLNARAHGDIFICPLSQITITPEEKIPFISGHLVSPYGLAQHWLNNDVYHHPISLTKLHKREIEYIFGATEFHPPLPKDSTFHMQHFHDSYEEYRSVSRGIGMMIAGSIAFIATMFLAAICAPPALLTFSMGVFVLASATLTVALISLGRKLGDMAAKNLSESIATDQYLDSEKNFYHQNVLENNRTIYTLMDEVDIDRENIRNLSIRMQPEPLVIHPNLVEQPQSPIPPTPSQRELRQAWLNRNQLFHPKPSVPANAPESITPVQNINFNRHSH